MAGTFGSAVNQGTARRSRSPFRWTRHRATRARFLIPQDTKMGHECQTEEPMPLGMRSALVAADDDDSRMLLATVFRRAGFNVIEASDGDELIERYSALSESSAPMIVVSDIGMPGCDGISATQRLRT